MKIEQEILINQFGQGIVEIRELLSLFESFDNLEKKYFFNEILYLIMQSKPMDNDIETAIRNSGLKSTYTPCVIIKKGVANYNLQRLINLPDNEWNKVFILLMNLFKIAYYRRFTEEKNNPDKWWYWDLSSEKIVNFIIQSKK